MATPRNLKTTVDNVAAVSNAITRLSELKLLVGIPDDKAGRRQGPASNAVIGYAMEFGIPPHVPARPFLMPTIKAMQAEIAAQFRKIALRATDGDIPAIEKLMKILGTEVADKVKARITAGIPPPLKPATVEARLRRTQGGRRMLKTMRKKGTDLAAWAAQRPQRVAGQTIQGVANMVPLIDSGQLRAAITYVVRKKPAQLWTKPR